jgi:tRNA nucleotidyltransferase/poly(A) polymerase
MNLEGTRTLPQLDPEKQREFAVEVVRRLRERGFEALWAGGCVRDFVMGRKPKDYDVATTARPEEIRDIFGQRRTVPVGAAFGVIAVLGSGSAGQIDVVTFRQDKSYSDSRRPDAVEFSTPEADAERRDFTINGLFYDPLENRVIDFVGGQEDLARGIVRAIGDPLARFGEDKLRLLRAVRFAATFGFELEPATSHAIREMAAEVTRVSAERIAAEMRLMLVDRSRTRAASLLRDAGLLQAILPELSTAGEAWQFTLKVLDRLDLATFPLALAALLHSLLPASVYEVCRRWKLSNHDTERAERLVAKQNALLEARQMAWSRLQRILIAEGIDELLQLHEAVARARDCSTAHVEYCRELLKMPRDQLDPPPLVTGDDLIAHGVRRGKQYQKLLEAVRDAQLDKKITTKQEALALVDELVAGGSGAAEAPEA